MGIVFSGPEKANKQRSDLVERFAGKIFAWPKKCAIPTLSFLKNHNNRLFSSNLVPIKFGKRFDSGEPAGET